MKTSAIFVICFCVIQHAFSQLTSRGKVGLGEAGFNGLGSANYGNVAVGGAGYSSLGVPDVSAYAQLPVSGPYGGTGTGELSVAGEVTASGTSVVTGQVPVIGTVQFSGSIPASGVVSLAGNCGCANAV